MSDLQSQNCRRWLALIWRRLTTYRLLIIRPTTSTYCQNLVQNGVVRLIDDGVIPGTKLEPGTLPAEALGEGSVVEGTIADGAVTADKLGNEAVTTRALLAGAVTARAMAADSVNTAALQDGSITADKIAVGALDGADLQPATVDRAALAKPSVGTTELLDAAVDQTKLAGNSVGNAQIIAGAVSTQSLKTTVSPPRNTQPGVSTARPSATAKSKPCIRGGRSRFPCLGANSVDTGKINRARSPTTTSATARSSGKINSVDGQRSTLPASLPRRWGWSPTGAWIR